VKQKKPQIGDLVRIVEYDSEWGRAYATKRIGIVVGHYGIRSKVEWSDGTYSEPMRVALEVL